MFTRILVPTDFSEPSDAALAYAQNLADRFGASLHLLHVIDDPITTGMFVSEASVVDTQALVARGRSDAENHLQARRILAQRSGLRTTVEVQIGASAKTILAAANDLQVDLIVMGTHGRTGVAHAVMGSVAERVVRTSPCPVLTVHASPAVVVKTAPSGIYAALPA